MSSMVTQVTYWPDGCEPDAPDADMFAVTVEWRGAGKYRVTNRGRTLSRAGNWAWSVPPFRRHQYRFDSLEHAGQWAQRVVNDVEVMGRTWVEFQAWEPAR